MCKIAVLLTCHNRKEKTIACLRSLFNAVETFNNNQISSDKIIPSVFVTDDGCTDGTANAVKNEFSNQTISIQNGDGTLFWAGGMRLAWNEALSQSKDWKFFLLLNDDTILFDNALDELFNIHYYCLQKYQKVGIYSGITCGNDDSEKITYGGDVWVNKFTGARKRLGVSNKPQLCDMANGNIMLIPCEIVSAIGIFHSGYIHAYADFDYSCMARSKSFPVLVSANICGCCNNDHKSSSEMENIKAMNRYQRIEYFNNPLHSVSDYLTFVRRTQPNKYLVTLLFRWLNIYMPHLYYWLNNKR